MARRSQCRPRRAPGWPRCGDEFGPLAGPARPGSAVRTDCFFDCRHRARRGGRRV